MKNCNYLINKATKLLRKNGYSSKGRPLNETNPEQEKIEKMKPVPMGGQPGYHLKKKRHP